jgi:hypothetical protein
MIIYQQISCVTMEAMNVKILNLIKPYQEIGHE